MARRLSVPRGGMVLAQLLRQPQGQPQRFWWAAQYLLIALRSAEDALACIL